MSRYLIIYYGAYLSLICLALLNYVIDPYGLYHFAKIDGVNWPKPEIAHSTKIHKSFQVARVKPQAIVLGTSRSAFGINPESKAWGGNIKPRYNLALPGGDIYVTRRFLEHTNATAQLKQVIFGLDFFSFNANRQIAADYREDILAINVDGSKNSRYGYNIATSALLSTGAIKASFKTIINKNKDPITVNHAGMLVGKVWKDNIRQGFNNMEELYIKYVYYAGNKREYSFINAKTGESSLEEFRKIVVLCKKSNIDLKLFISPPHSRHLEIIRVLGIWPLFEEWKRELVRILHEEKYDSRLWDFSGYNSYSTDDISKKIDHYYRDSTHYLPILGDIILARMFNYEDTSITSNFGYALTVDNIEDNLQRIQREQEKYQTDYPDDVKDIESLAKKIDFDISDTVLKRSGHLSKARWFRSNFRNNPISKALKDHERGVPLEKLIATHSITEKTFNEWKRVYDKNM